MTYTGHMVDDLTTMVARAEANAPRIDGGQPIPEIQPVRSRVEISRDWVKRYCRPNEDGLLRCTECDEFKELVDGTDNCVECLKKLEAL